MQQYQSVKQEYNIASYYDCTIDVLIHTDVAYVARTPVLFEGRRNFSNVCVSTSLSLTSLRLFMPDGCDAPVGGLFVFIFIV